MNKYKINNLTPYTTYEIYVAAGNYYGFDDGAISSFLTSEEGECSRCVLCKTCSNCKFTARQYCAKKLLKLP